MVTLPQLWLPILLSAVLVVIAAAVMWLVMPHHRSAGTELRAARPVPVNSLALHLVYALIVSIMVAYVTGRSVEPGADYKAVFRMAASTGILAYAFGVFAGAIWGTRTWEGAWKEAFDGVVYGLVTGGPFGWLWPEA